MKNLGLLNYHIVCKNRDIVFVFNRRLHCKLNFLLIIFLLKLKAYQDWAEVVKTNNDHENYGILKIKMEEIQNEIDTSSLSQESSSSSTPEDHNLYELTPDELEMLESGIF